MTRIYCSSREYTLCRKENLWIFTVDSTHPEDSKIKQVTKVQVRYSPIDESTGITTLLVEIALLNDAEEETSLSLSNVPPFQRLLPQKFILDIVSMGGWTRNGIDLLSTSNSVEFDDVEEWWENSYLYEEMDLLSDNGSYDENIMYYVEDENGKFHDIFDYLNTFKTP